MARCLIWRSLCTFPKLRENQWRNGYLPWQLCRQDCARLSQLLRQGPLNVIGQTRRQDESSFEHFVRQASTAPRPFVCCPPPPVFADAPNENTESKATQNIYFMACLLAAGISSIFMDNRRKNNMAFPTGERSTQGFPKEPNCLGVRDGVSRSRAKLTTQKGKKSARAGRSRVAIATPP
jgi:hypothetical protein